MRHQASHGSRYPDHGAWAEMMAEISEKNSRLSNLVAKRWPPRSGTGLLTELERERSRIARELHAGAGQPLAGIKIHLEILDEIAASIPDSAKHDSAVMTIGRLQTLAEQALSQVRAVSHRLHPPDWQEMSMQQAMEFLLESSGLTAKLKVTGDFPTLPEEPSHGMKVQIYRCAQECISNITRHSGATEASISLRGEDGRLLLTVTDNGRGFDAISRGSRPGNPGIGLRAIGENAELMGGTSAITSSGEGTRIEVTLPYSTD